MRWWQGLPWKTWALQVVGLVLFLYSGHLAELVGLERHLVAFLAGILVGLGPAIRRAWARLWRRWGIVTFFQGLGLLLLFSYSEEVARYFDWERHNVTVWAGVLFGAMAVWGWDLRDRLMGHRLRERDEDAPI